MSVKSVREMNVGVKPTKSGMSSAVADNPVKTAPNNLSVSFKPSVNATVIKEETTPVDEKGVVLSSDWIRLDLVSNFVFYDWTDISARPFKPRDQAKLALGVRNRNMSFLFDVISATSTRDARKLVFSDWASLCILHKRFSYSDTPYNITWNSRYGVTASNNTKIIKMTEKKLSATRKEYLEWTEKYGLVMPTCDDVELIATSLDNEETLYLFEKAQYLDPTPLKDRIEELRKKGDRIPSITARIEKLDELGIKYFNLIEEFQEAFSDFGIEEKAVVEIDYKDFNPEIAIEALRNFKSVKEDSFEAKKEVEAALQEANQIEALYSEAKENTGEHQPIIINYKPRTEEVPLAFSPWTMFPYT